jgi:hypothetical protein
MTETEVLRDLESAIQERAEGLDQPGALLTGFVLVCEWADPEKDGRELTEHVSESLTPWSANGMLNHALAQEWDDE